MNINEKLTRPPATLNVIQFDVLQKQLEHDLSFCMNGICRMNSTCSFLVASAHIPWFRITLLQQSNITLYEINTLQHLLLVMFAVNIRTVRSVASNIRTAMCLAETFRGNTSELSYPIPKLSFIEEFALGSCIRPHLFSRSTRTSVTNMDAHFGFREFEPRDRRSIRYGVYVSAHKWL